MRRPRPIAMRQARGLWSTHRWSLSFWAALVALLLGALVAGCGQTAGGTLAPVGSTPAPQNCGAVQLRGTATLNGTDAGQAETCFYQAYQQCQRASLAVNEMGVDAGTDRTFTTQAGSRGACGIADAVYSYVIPTQHSSTTTYNCTGLSRKDGGLLFSACGADGDFYVPAPAAS
jgi:hypothetical protein